jgi:hypothetical protein
VEATAVGLELLGQGLLGHGHILHVGVVIGVTSDGRTV